VDEAKYFANRTEALEDAHHHHPTGRVKRRSKYDEAVARLIAHLLEQLEHQERRS
jgi:hypothetical protein